MSQYLFTNSMTYKNRFGDTHFHTKAAHKILIISVKCCHSSLNHFLIKITSSTKIRCEIKTVNDIFIPFIFSFNLNIFIILLNPSITSKSKRGDNGKPSRSPLELLKKTIRDTFTRTTNCTKEIHDIIQFVTDIGNPI